MADDALTGCGLIDEPGLVARLPACERDRDGSAPHGRHLLILH